MFILVSFCWRIIISLLVQMDSVDSILLQTTFTGTLGQTGTINCFLETFSEEVLETMKLRYPPDNIIYKQKDNTSSPSWSLPTGYKAVLSHPRGNMLNLTVWVENIQCYHEAEPVVCTVEYTKPLPQPGKLLSETQSANLRAAVFPGQPEIVSVLPVSLLHENYVMEGDLVSISVKALLGRPSRGQLLWTLHRGKRIELIFQDDHHLSQTRLGIWDCQEQVTSTFEFIVSREDHEFRAEVFVANLDHRIRTPDICEDKMVGLCDFTQHVQVHYAITEEDIRTSRTPVGNVSIGDNVTFTCEADGIPAPTLKWTKEVEGLSEHLASAETSMLVYTIIMGTDGTAVYRCTASQLLNGTTTEISKSLEVTVEDSMLVLYLAALSLAFGFFLFAIMGTVCFYMAFRKEPLKIESLGHHGHDHRVTFQDDEIPLQKREMMQPDQMSISSGDSLQSHKNRGETSV